MKDSEGKRPKKRITPLADVWTYVGMIEVREGWIHLAEGRFSLTGKGRY
jgi:hypothetical protein